MATRKRWSDVYEGGNPLALPQAIRKEIKAATKNPSAGRLNYLWLVFTGEVGRKHDRATLDRWLNVVDEAASQGVQTMVISAAGHIADRDEVWEIAQWAINTHGLCVGLHLYDPVIAPSDVEKLQTLGKDHVCLFVEHDKIDTVREAVNDIVRVIEADGLEDGVVQPKCELPHQMTCVGHGGKLWTCGLVMGRNGFYLGDVNERRIDHVMNDESLPHHVPENTSNDSNRCAGCPPLLHERLRKAFNL